jgi:vanillate O-demethylase monooxygenase subunit
MTFLQNCWYMAGWSKELKPGAMLARRIANEPLLLFRDGEGRAQALFDRCPHRFAPLHLGQLEAGRIRCAYHGLAFDGSGTCVHNPHGDQSIPRGAQVRSFQLEERHGCLWLWPGDVDRADPERIPDFSCLEGETHHVGYGYLHAKANYMLETDNIMDLSHIQFLHPDTLGSAATSGGETEVSQSGSTIWSKRHNREPLSAFLAKTVGLPVGTVVDRRMDVRWDPPSTMLIYAFSQPIDQPDSAPRGRMIANIFSPETESTTHYWFAVSYDRRALGPDGPAIAQRSTDELLPPFESEDLPMLEAVQHAMDGNDFWALRPVILPGDAAAVRARRVLDKLIREEVRERRATGK